MISFNVDPEHAGLRVAIFGLFLVVWAVIYLLVSLLLPQSGFNLIGIFGGLVGAAVFTQAIDTPLKRRWRSGREVRLIDQHIEIGRGGTAQSERRIDGSQHVNVLFWYFEIKKRTRIPKGWYMVATALHQDEHYLAVYTFVSPEDFPSLPYSQHHTKLSPRQEEADLRLAGQQRRLHLAEEVRWNEGGEMSHTDYVTYLNHLKQQFPSWMPAD
ncbi:MAG: hypothetical protein MUF87_07190 [Anaerolineae bacterium]|jgi:hypothetical protein|nr:hypothetical protein [Anaerolineae bacterium]